MPTNLAFLRGINVGGNNIIKMEKLRELCTATGLNNVRTYIQSGNIVFESNLSEAALIKKLEQALHAHMKKPILVMVRSAKEITDILSKNPFKKQEPKKVGVMLFAQKVPKNVEKEFTIEGPEELTIIGREIYINFPNGMGQAKIKFPKAAEKGTVRNINTLNKLSTLSLS